MELSDRDEGVLILRESSPIMDFLYTVTPARAPARVVPSHSASVHSETRTRARRPQSWRSCAPWRRVRASASRPR